MPRINRRSFIATASAAGALAATQPWSALSALAGDATKTFSGPVTIPEGFTVPAGEIWEFDPGTSTTVIVEKNVVVYGTLRMRPSSSAVVHTLRFESIDESKFVGGGMDVLESDVGLWVMGFGILDANGSPKTAWNKTGWDGTWSPNDEVRVAPTGIGDYGGSGFDGFGPGDTVPSIGLQGATTDIQRSFSDTASSPFADDIESIAAAGITSGYGDGRFGPNDGVTRAQMAAFLVRALELPSSGSAGFSDVSGHWAESVIDSLAAAGITSGYGDGRFGPNDGVTRAQMAAFLVRALELPSSGSAGFSDVSGHWAESVIDSLAAAGITSGYGDGRFGPNDGVTRGQMAAFLTRGLDLPPVVSEVSASSTLNTEVLNLSRNVKIQGTEGGRSHVLIRSSVPQNLSYIELRHMAPRQGSGDETDGVLGRYGLHFHHCGDGSRGSVVTGVVVAAAGFHAFVPHMSHGITFTDCISYDTIDHAYWWDKPDSTHDIAWINCVASLVRYEPSFRGYRLAGFVLGSGEGSSAIGCVATGVQGARNASGFHWPELPHTTDGIWEFSDCVAHNNKRNGIFTWQNTGNVHEIDSFTAYRNGAAGIEHGAYVNRYEYRNSVIAECETGLKVHANSKEAGPVIFEDLSILDCDVAIELTGSNGTPNQPTLFRSIALADNRIKVRINGASNTSKPRVDLFEDVAISPSDVEFVRTNSGSTFTFRPPGGTEWMMDDTGQVS